MKISASKNVCSLCTPEIYYKDYNHLCDLLQRWHTDIPWETIYHHVLREYIKEGILVEGWYRNCAFICKDCAKQLLKI